MSLDPQNNAQIEAWIEGETLGTPKEKQVRFDLNLPDSEKEIKILWNGILHTFPGTENVEDKLGKITPAYQIIRTVAEFDAAWANDQIELIYIKNKLVFPDASYTYQVTSPKKIFAPSQGYLVYSNANAVIEYAWPTSSIITDLEIEYHTTINGSGNLSITASGNYATSYGTNPNNPYDPTLTNHPYVCELRFLSLEVDPGFNLEVYGLFSSTGPDLMFRKVFICENISDNDIEYWNSGVSELQYSSGVDIFPWPEYMNKVQFNRTLQGNERGSGVSVYGNIGNNKKSRLDNLVEVDPTSASNFVHRHRIIFDGNEGFRESWTGYGTGYKKVIYKDNLPWVTMLSYTKSTYQDGVGHMSILGEIAPGSSSDPAITTMDSMYMTTRNNVYYEAINAYDSGSPQSIPYGWYGLRGSVKPTLRVTSDQGITKNYVARNSVGIDQLIELVPEIRTDILEFNFKYDTSTDPLLVGVGNIGFNNTDLTAATIMFMSAIDLNDKFGSDGESLAQLISMGLNGKIIIQSHDDPTLFAAYSMTGYTINTVPDRIEINCTYQFGGVSIASAEYVYIKVIPG